MSDVKRIRAPFDEATARSLRAGDRVLITGTIIAARDAAHKRLVEALDRGEELPVDLDGAVIYYVGPSPARPGRAIGAAGPTTAGRMDAYTPTLLARGLRGMIGKGYRKPEVVEAMMPAFGPLYGNASSMHTFGGQMGRYIQQAREQVAGILGADPEEIVFTSCGSESDNSAWYSATETQP